MEAIVTMIQTVGFPIVCVLGLAYFIYLIWNKQNDNFQVQVENMAARCQAREDKLYEQIDKFNDTLNSFNTTLVKIDSRLEVLEHSLKE